MEVLLFESLKNRSSEDQEKISKSSFSLEKGSTYGRGHALVDFLVNLRFMYAIAHGHRIASEQIAVLESRGRDHPMPRQSVD
ncbi:unnamed protein product [Urochloa humidicola]